MEKEYAIGIDLGGTSVKYALIDNEGVFYFQGKLPSKADESAEAVIGQLVTAINEAKAFAQEKGYKIDGIGIGTPGIVDCTNRVVLGGAENINGWENIHLADHIESPSRPFCIDNLRGKELTFGIHLCFFTPFLFQTPLFIILSRTQRRKGFFTFFSAQKENAA